MKINIEIKVVEVKSKHNAKGTVYHVCEVFYKNDKDETKSYKQMDFTNKAMFSKLEKLKPGHYEVEMQKNAKDYWDWISIGPVDPNTVLQAPLATPNVTTNFEDKKQRLIVRQNCIGNAVAFLNAINKDGSFDEDSVIKVAKEFEHFVYGTSPVTMQPAVKKKPVLKVETMEDLEDLDLVNELGDIPY